MSAGARIRAILGPSAARRVGRVYRQMFVNLKIVAECVAAELPVRAAVLDVGGGDGEPLNALLDLRSDITVTTIDLPAQVGQWIEPRHEGRVTKKPSTSLEAFRREMERPPDVVIVSDVMHHVPAVSQSAFLRSLLMLAGETPAGILVVKDVEPGYPRAHLGFMSDRYITGDRGISPLSRRRLLAMARGCVPAILATETPLFQRDAPNYALVFRHE